MLGATDKYDCPRLPCELPTQHGPLGAVGCCSRERLRERASDQAPIEVPSPTVAKRVEKARDRRRADEHSRAADKIAP
ncbi:hypothetical protein D3C81_2226410 [compost metagenome]